MSEEPVTSPRPQPQLDETLDAKPYEPPKNDFPWLIALAVVGLLVILLGFLLLPPVKRVRQAAPRAGCKNNLRQIAVALHLYADDNGGEFPPDTSWLYTSGYAEDPKIVLCPSRSGTSQKDAASGRLMVEHPGYVYVSGLRASDPGTCVVAFDRLGNHDGKGRNALRLDSGVLWIKAPSPSEQDPLQTMLDATRDAARKRGGEIKLVGE
ncbi:MAG TPA: DUF1559 domain-containing protein [Planctomycetota bacterium]|nr:DUF1559 domain-containing protein [Planctomycetota bacterium]